jgi:pyrimidine-nucleoside phosphorylase
MRAIDIIRTKRDGHTLSHGEIDAFVQGVTDGSWPDYQVTAFLMAVFLRGMTLEEATHLTQAMVESGTRADCSDLLGPGNGSMAVDKHSTGGVGDKTSLILAPLAAACGAIVPMMSGRGLGHTGGTLDKLAAIPGFRTDLSVPKMRKALAETGCVLIRQTAEMAPADRRMYGLRDATGTVESIPLIASSILSKKVTEGIGALVLDVKVGSGGFMEDLDHARELAAWLVGISERSGLRTEALLTRMGTPLGRRVGNASEVQESIATLRGEGPADLESLSVLLAARMLVLGGVAHEDEAEGKIREALHSGRGLEKFRQVIAAQGGDPRVIDDPSLLPLADREAFVTAPRTGVVTRIDAGAVGRAAVALGAGRDHVDAAVDPAVGIDLIAIEGSSVREGDPILKLYYRDAGRLEAARHYLRDALTIGDVPPPAQPLVIERIDRHSAAVAALQTLQ